MTLVAYLFYNLFSNLFFAIFSDLFCLFYDLFSISFFVLCWLFCDIVYLYVLGGNFKKGHCNEVASTINSNKEEGHFTKKFGHQCKLKWNNMWKKYMAEKASQNSTGGVKSIWPFYIKIDDIIGALPKVMFTFFTF